MARAMEPDWLVPELNVEGVGSLMTTRRGGISASPFDSFNVSEHTGDAPAAVAYNRARLEFVVEAVPVYLKQVHGARVVRLGPEDAQVGAPVHEADACITTDPGLACTVLVADCLPVLFAAPAGRVVGAAHAGWRGLAAGVLEATLQAVCEAAVCHPSQVQVWLGACIGREGFEVGADVLEAFGTDADVAAASCFAPCASGKWLADLPRLARDRLRGVGVEAVKGGKWCTVTDASRFYSFRRDRITGRMAALVWIKDSVRR